MLLARVGYSTALLPSFARLDFRRRDISCICVSHRRVSYQTAVCLLLFTAPLDTASSGMPCEPKKAIRSIWRDGIDAADGTLAIHQGGVPPRHSHHVQVVGGMLHVYVSAATPQKSGLLACMPGSHTCGTFSDAAPSQLRHMHNVLMARRGGLLQTRGVAQATTSSCDVKAL